MMENPLIFEFTPNEIENVMRSLTTVAIVLMMFEATVYLAYYKDIFFAIFTLLSYIGMYVN
jgi:hypothetical protein